MAVRRFTTLLLLGAAGACGGGDAATVPAGGPPPAEVRTLTLAPKPIPQTTEYVATIRSRRSATIQPQVEGFVTRIFVRSGDRVRTGQPLIQIDADKQQAAVSSLESARAARAADVAFATQQLQRMQTLLEAGAVSRQELEQAETQFKTAEAQLAAIDAQIRESRVELQYYRVTAPSSGTVGDIPVRVGDRVERSTMLTTIDAAEGLEAYVSVPLEESAGLAIGLPVELLDRDGQVIATNPISFVAPRAENDTQSVLVKSLLRDPPATIRVLQYIRARIVWSREPALAVPVVAVSRVSGQYFVFVAEPAGQGFVARQKPIAVGDLVGEDYLVRGGLAPGERVIVSNIQKIGDGAPVKPVG
jgi:RND family efflux transporter MFP subunit